MHQTRPIPTLSDLDNRDVIIHECGEPMIKVDPVDRLKVCPAYFARGFATAGSSVYLRTGVVEVLHAATRTLPDNLCILIYDGFRSLETQKEIADRFAADLLDCPLSNELRAATISRFVSPLPGSEAEYHLAPPPHCTGAAVDVGLATVEGTLIDLGAEFDQFDDVAATAYYEGTFRRIKSANDRTRRDMRRLLYWTMVRAGFAPYPDEYWHFELGTRRAAAFFGLPAAKYGGIATWPQGKVAML